MPDNIHNIPFEKLKQTFYDILFKYGFFEQKAELLAEVFASSSLDGVYSHGVNRFPRFIETVRKGYVKKVNEPIKTGSFGSVEKWDGKGGAGILNARMMMNRAIEIAKSSGIACVGLSNTNHWMRGGTYGWQAAEEGFIGICFTNTKPNMIPWGGREPRLGNNPMIMAVPRKEGHIVLDMAMSQYSFGKIQQYAMEGKPLPYPGGFDDQGNITNDPDIVFNNEKALPIGYWKGSALSMMLDLLATILSGGDSTSKIAEKDEEYGLSQVFIAIKPSLISLEHKEKLIREIIDFTHDVQSNRPGERTYYPGEKTLITRKHNLKHGIPVSNEIWDEIQDLL